MMWPELRVIDPEIGLALSGGGWRAALFHLGILRRLAEERWLDRIDVISMVSGGSLLGAFMLPRWKAMIDAGGDVNAFQQNIAEPFTAMLSSRSFIADWARRVPGVLFRKLREPAYTRTTLAAEMVGEWLADGRALTDLPEKPYGIFNASSLISGRAWRFTRDGLGDSRFGYATWPDRRALSVGFAAGASAAFPPVFTPARIRSAEYRFGQPPYGESPLKIPAFIPLSDGGVYDNLGIEVFSRENPPYDPLAGVKIGRPKFLIASDGGYPPQQRFRSNGLPVLGSGLLLFRVDEMARDQVGALRRRMLAGELLSGKQPGAIANLGSSIATIERRSHKAYCRSADPERLIPDRFLPRIQSTRTQLNRFSAVEAEALAYHAYLLLDAVLTLYRDTQPKEYQVRAPGDWTIDLSGERASVWDGCLERSRPNA